MLNAIKKFFQVKVLTNIEVSARDTALIKKYRAQKDFVKMTFKGSVCVITKKVEAWS
jgi:hypothetical protein